MTTKTIAALVCASGIAGCATAPSAPPVVPIVSAWEPSQAQRQIERGPNAITGSAFMRQRGGGVVTCAGSVVNLVPATAYAIERMRYLYGSSPEGFIDLFSPVRKIQFNPNPPDYQTLQTSTKCDAQGKFELRAVADGEYFIIVGISWSAGNLPQGGSLMRKVRVAGGEVASIVMSQ